MRAPVNLGGCHQQVYYPYNCRHGYQSGSRYILLKASLFWLIWIPPGDPPGYRVSIGHA